MDRNGDGQFDRSEMYRALQQMGLLLTVNELTSVMDGFKLMAARAAQLAPASAPKTAMHARQALTHEDTLSEEVLRKLHVRFQAASYTAGGQDWPRLFGIVDRDHNGVLSQEELVRIVRKELKIPPTDIPDSTVGKFCRIFDSSGDGQLDVQELVTFLEHGPQSLSAKAKAAPAAGVPGAAPSVTSSGPAPLLAASPEGPTTDDEGDAARCPAAFAAAACTAVPCDTACAVHSYVVCFGKGQPGSHFSAVSVPVPCVAAPGRALLEHGQRFDASDCAAAWATRHRCC